jgi:hypothetical protein
MENLNSSGTVVRRNSVNPESLPSKDGAVKVGTFNRSRNDINSSICLSAT